jgi:hypothetical protein
MSLPAFVGQFLLHQSCPFLSDRSVGIRRFSTIEQKRLVPESDS